MQLDVAGEVGRDESSRLVSLFCALASIPSPTGREGACAEAVTAELAALGLDVHPDGAGSAVGSDSDNLYCRIAGNVAGQPLFFCAHLDTVPPTGPLRPVVVDGVIRNATPAIIGADNKAAVAVLLEAVRTLVLDNLPHAGVELLFTIGEEQGLLGSRAVDPSTLLASSGFVLDHPGAIGGYVDAAPSRFIVRATMRGRAAHSAISPDDGINAIVPLARAITMFPAATPTVNVNVGLVRGGSVLNIVPEFAELAVDVRAIEHQEGQVVIAQIPLRSLRLPKAPAASSKSMSTIAIRRTGSLPTAQLFVSRPERSPGSGCP